MDQVKTVEYPFSTPQDLEHAFQSMIDRTSHQLAGTPRLAEFGALLVGDNRINRAIFPDVILNLSNSSRLPRGFGARAFPELLLAADPQSGRLFVKMRAHVDPIQGNPQLVLKANEDIYINKADLWDIFSDGDKLYLQELGLGPNLSADEWGNLIKDNVRTTSRTICNDTVVYTKDLSPTIRYGSIGTRVSFDFSTDFVVHSLMSCQFRLPGDEVVGFGSAHIHPISEELTGLDEQLAKRVGEDTIHKLPNLAEARTAMQIGAHLISAYPSLSDIMTTIDSQYENQCVLRPFALTNEQFQEYALVIVSVSEKGKVLGSKTFSYDAVARSGDIEQFDQLVDRAYRSMVSDSPDIGLMSEAVQEIAQYTFDNFPEYVGGP